VIVIQFIHCAIATDIVEGINERDDLKEFRKYLTMDPVLPVLLKHRSGTVFAPTDEAFRRYRQTRGDMTQEQRQKLASLHTLGIEARKDLFPLQAASQIPDAAPLYMTSVEPSIYQTNALPPFHRWQSTQKEYFVNNAKIIAEERFQTQNGDGQLLYVIDEVLEPYLPRSPISPTALELLRQPDNYNLGENLGAFAARVAAERMEEPFERAGNHTFFIPISVSDRARDIDALVIRGHVVPQHVLFLRTAGSAVYQSDAYGDNIKVDISIENRTSLNREQAWLAQSNTLQSDADHKKGIVMSKVVRANIPVKNGVVHLIDKPLMIIDISLYDFLNFESNNRLKIFNELLSRVPDVRSEIQNPNPKTLLPPTDDAFTALGAEELNRLRNNPEEIRKILKLHIVPGNSVSSDDVRNGRIEKLPSLDTDTAIYFRYLGDDQAGRLTMEAGGVTASAVQADIGATNGIIHVLDRVLGMPFQTVREKLKTDPDLNVTFEIGYENPQRDWNEELGDMERNFTYFVPSNEAWKKVQLDYPSEYKQLVEKIHPQHARKILDRHLHVGSKYMIADLSGMSSIRTRQGNLTIVKTIAGSLLIEWEGIQARIERPNVEAVNGVIHVIDQVLMLRRDMMVSHATLVINSPAVSLLTLVITSILYIVLN